MLCVISMCLVLNLVLNVCTCIYSIYHWLEFGGSLRELPTTNYNSQCCTAGIDLYMFLCKPLINRGYPVQSVCTDIHRPGVQIYTGRVYRYTQAVCTDIHRSCVQIYTGRVYRYTQAVCTDIHRSCVQIYTGRVYRYTQAVCTDIHRPCVQIYTGRMYRYTQAVCTDIHRPCVQIYTGRVYRYTQVMCTDIHRPCVQIYTGRVYRYTQTMCTDIHRPRYIPFLSTCFLRLAPLLPDFEEYPVSRLTKVDKLSSERLLLMGNSCKEMWKQVDRKTIHYS